MDDRYDPVRMFRREVFKVALRFLESESLTEKAVAESLKSCIEFFVSGADGHTTRDFCMAKMQLADEDEHE